MKELLLYIARSLVQHPDQVTVTEVETGDELTLELRVASRRIWAGSSAVKAASPRRSVPDPLLRRSAPA